MKLMLSQFSIPDKKIIDTLEEIIELMYSKL